MDLMKNSKKSKESGYGYSTKFTSFNNQTGCSYASYSLAAPYGTGRENQVKYIAFAFNSDQQKLSEI